LTDDWRTKTFWDALQWGTREHGDRVAIIAGTQRTSFSELAQRARALARGLIEHGVQPGDNVALWSPDCIEWLVARWAVPAMGAVLVPINTRFRDEEIGFLLSQSQSKALIVSTGAKGINYFDILEQIDPEFRGYRPGDWESEVFSNLSLVVGIGDDLPTSVVRFADLESEGRTLADCDGLFDDCAQKITATDIAQIMYTSGTTSFPKGAQVRHGALLQNNFNTIARMNLGPEDRYLASVALFSATGTSFTLSPFLAGGAIVLMEDGFSAQRFCELVESERITMSFYVEPIVRDLKNYAGLADHDLSTLRTGTGAPLQSETFRWLVEDLGVSDLTNVYGLSETSNATCRSFWNDQLEDRIVTCGHPMPNIKIRIADPETDREISGDEMGEIQVNSYTVMPGYYNMPDETAATMTADGWLKTGDLGTIRSDGQLIFRGRLKEMIKPGGFNVATLEVESFIKNIPGVIEVAIVGVPDERMGEIGYAYVETATSAKVDADTIVNYCRSHIASYKVPRYVEFVKEWPLTGSGKIKKLSLSEQARQQISDGQSKDTHSMVAENRQSTLKEKTND